ncbi:exopolysaccharide biosynthesis protein [Azospirillum brasilense]|nr:exopolysaccharide biosynthesis protein [Azospirillum brasilense]
MITRAPTSVILNGILGEAPAEHVTLDWLAGRLGHRSFGVILLLLALLGVLPGISAMAGVLLTIVAFHMILDRPGPAFPRRIATRHVETRRLAAITRRAVPVLRYLERFIRPRWAAPFTATKRVVDDVVLLLGASLLVPVPLSNLSPGAALLLSVIAVGTVWQAMSAAGWLPSVL